MENIGNNIMELRKAKGVTQEALLMEIFGYARACIQSERFGA